MSKIQKLFKALENGNVLTAPQIKARFGLRNPSAAVSRLNEVYSVQSYQERNSRGKLVTKYRYF